MTDEKSLNHRWQQRRRAAAFKRADIQTLQEMLNKRRSEGGWNPTILAEIEAEIQHREEGNI